MTPFRARTSAPRKQLALKEAVESGEAAVDTAAVVPRRRGVGADMAELLALMDLARDRRRRKRWGAQPPPAVGIAALVAVAVALRAGGALGKETTEANPALLPQPPNAA